MVGLEDWKTNETVNNSIRIQVARGDDDIQTVGGGRDVLHEKRRLQIWSQIYGFDSRQSDQAYN